MRFLVDEGVPRDVAAILREGGHEAHHVYDLELGGASDEELLARALAADSVIVTLDADFHKIVAERGLGRPSIIRFRFNGLRAGVIADHVAGIADQIGNRLLAGVLVSVTPHGVRVRSMSVTRG